MVFAGAEKTGRDGRNRTTERLRKAAHGRGLDSPRLPSGVQRLSRLQILHTGLFWRARLHSQGNAHRHASRQHPRREVPRRTRLCLRRSPRRRGRGLPPHSLRRGRPIHPHHLRRAHDNRHRTAQIPHPSRMEDRRRPRRRRDDFRLRRPAHHDRRADPLRPRPLLRLNTQPPLSVLAGLRRPRRATPPAQTRRRDHLRRRPRLPLRLEHQARRSALRRPLRLEEPHPLPHLRLSVPRNGTVPHGRGLRGL